MKEYQLCLLSERVESTELSKHYRGLHSSKIETKWKHLAQSFRHHHDLTNVLWENVKERRSRTKKLPFHASRFRSQLTFLLFISSTSIASHFITQGMRTNWRRIQLCWIKVRTICHAPEYILCYSTDKTLALQSCRSCFHSNSTKLSLRKSIFQQ